MEEDRPHKRELTNRHGEFTRFASDMTEWLSGPQLKTRSSLAGCTVSPKMKSHPTRTG
jgi:hypothetical protein